jgi:hypothetical protein
MRASDIWRNGSLEGRCCAKCIYGIPHSATRPGTLFSIRLNHLLKVREWSSIFGRGDMLDDTEQPSCLAAKQTQEQQTTPTSSIYHILRIGAIRPRHDESSNFPTAYNIHTAIPLSCAFSNIASAYQPAATSNTQHVSLYHHLIDARLTPPSPNLTA